jgi:hypothetical protein
MLLGTEGRSPKTQKGSGMQTFLIMLVLIAAIAAIGLQVFIILSVRQTQDLVREKSRFVWAACATVVSRIHFANARRL